MLALKFSGVSAISMSWLYGLIEGSASRKVRLVYSVLRIVSIWLAFPFSVPSGVDFPPSIVPAWIPLLPIQLSGSPGVASTFRVLALG